VRDLSEDQLQPNRWWRDTGDAMSVTREWIGVENA
jgi:hypothetical protein